MPEDLRGQAAESLFRSIAEYTYDWETWVDQAGVPRWINAAVQRITGFGVSECLARQDYPLGLVHADDRDMFSAILRDAAGGGAGNDVEFRILHKDTSERWVAISWQSVRDARGNPAGYRTSVRDIDERKRMERELSELRRRAESAVVARSELLANVSHELRSPAHCIAGFAELLDASTLDARQRRYVELIQEQCAGMQRQVEDLLQLAALEAGGLRFEREPTDLVALLRTLEESLRPAARHKGLEFTFELGPAPLWVEVDPGRLGQVLRNLLDNAIKFTERGEVRLSLRSQPSERGLSQVEIEIADTGCGMNVDEARRVLAPFEQLDSSTRRRHGGVGLGLAIAHRLVTHAGGSLEIASSKGSGTKVTLKLALARVDAPRPVPADKLASERLAREPEGALRPGAAGTPVPHTGRALIVDDSAPARELLVGMLQLAGWQASEAASGSAARKLLASEDFDLILLDYQMPDADGGETAIGLRRLCQTRRSGRSTRIYLLTANLFAHEQLGELSVLDGVLAKPLSRARLLSLLGETPREGARAGPTDQLDSSLESSLAHPRARLDQAPSPGLLELDADVLSDLRDLRDKQGAAMLPRVARETLVAQEDQLRALAAALQKGDRAGAAVAAHAVAGQAAVVGARRVADQARALETGLEQRTLSTLAARAACSQLELSWRAAADELLRHVEADGSVREQDMKT